MNISKNTRVQVDRKIHQEFSIPWWDVWSLRIKIRTEYDMTFTCKRNGMYYFQPNDSQKYMMFVVYYGNYILNKPKKT